MTLPPPLFDGPENVIDISEYSRQAENALTYSFSLQYEKDEQILAEAYKSPWSIVKEAVMANPHAPAYVRADAYLLARTDPFSLDGYAHRLLLNYAGLPNLDATEYELLAQHSHLPLPRAVGGNPASSVLALQYAEQAFWEPYQVRTLLRHPLIPYDMAYRQIQKHTVPGWQHKNNGLDYFTLASLFLRTDWTIEQRTELFHLIFQHLTFTKNLPRQHTSGQHPVFERIINLIADGPEFPDEIKILAWHAALPALAELPQPLTLTLNGSLPSSLQIFLLSENCPLPILESACLLPYPLLRVTAANHSRCPEHSQVAAALYR